MAIHRKRFAQSVPTRKYARLVDKLDISPDQLQEVIQKLYPQGKLLNARQLSGGISSLTLLLEVGLPDETIHKLVLRQHGIVDRTRNPNIARVEYQLLRILQTAGLRIPEAYLVDTSNTILDIPYLLLEYIENPDLSVDPTRSFDKISDALIKIHSLDLVKYNLSILPDERNDLEDQLNSPPSGNEGIYAILKQAVSHIKLNKTALLHGDFWMGNFIWRGGEVFIIDWEDARLGDPLSDLGKLRLELTWAFGKKSASRFTTIYQNRMPSVDMTYLPFWDLWGAYRLSDFADWFDEQKIIDGMKAQFDTFVNDAIEQLSKLIMDI